MQMAAFLRLASGVGAVSVASRLAALALGILLARWLGPDGYGAYAFVMSVVVLAMIPAKAGLPDLVLREIAAAGVDPARGEPATLLGRAAMLVLGISLALVAAGHIAIAVFLGPEDRDLALGLGVGLWMLPGLALLTLCNGALRGLGQPVSAHALLELAPALVALALIAAAVLAAVGGQAELALMARLTGIVGSLGAIAVLLHRALGPRRRRGPGRAPSPRRLLRQAAPFLMLGGAQVVLSRTDLVMLGLLAEPRAAGFYKVALEGAFLVGMCLNIANTVLAREFSRRHARGDLAGLEQTAIRTARLTTAATAPLAVGLIVWGESLIVLTFGPDFAAAYPLLVILAIGRFLAGVFGSADLVLGMTGHAAACARLRWAAAGLNVVLNAALIPPYGAEGAAVATAIALLAWRGGAVLVLLRTLGVDSSIFALRAATR